MVDRSSLRLELYKPAFGGFVDVDILKDRKISLRTLVGFIDICIIIGFNIDRKLRYESD